MRFFSTSVIFLPAIKPLSKFIRDSLITKLASPTLTIMSQLFHTTTMTCRMISNKVIEQFSKMSIEKILIFIMSFVSVSYVITFLDSVNISYATLTMSPDLHFSPLIFGFGAGIFFIGYFILEIPVTVGIQKGLDNDKKIHDKKGFQFE